MRIKMLISYDGTDYCGWQRQKDHQYASPLPSIQQTMETALTKLFKEPIKVTSSGRTDSGVHAFGQIVHFDTTWKTPPKDMAWALKPHIPRSIAIKKAWIAPDDFHSILSATHKTYRYWIWNHPRQSALMDRYSLWVRQPLDLNYLNSLSPIIEQKRDFRSFQSVGNDRPSTVRQIYEAKWWQRKPGLVEFKITGNGFLKQMVRNLVGTELDLFQRQEPINRLEEILQHKDRQKAGRTAQPQGLFLSKVYYPQELDNRCREI